MLPENLFTTSPEHFNLTKVGYALAVHYIFDIRWLDLLTFNILSQVKLCVKVLPTPDDVEVAQKQHFAASAKKEAELQLSDGARAVS